ncbi:MAG: hypothetical protein LBT40_12490, partial [Deltaproteobacteria bacterium]|nr:hypothetical protein [Deltaproteobacteria bacterium]
MNAACAELYASAFKPRKREETPAPHWTPERQAAMRKRGPQPSDKHLAMSYFGYDLRLLKDGTLHIADILDRNRVYATIRLKFLCDDPETGCDLDALLA